MEPNNASLSSENSTQEVQKNPISILHTEKRTLSYKFYTFLKKWAEKKLTKVIPLETSEQETLFEPLSPIVSSESESPYYDALEWALGNPDVKNIAITGPYGSGKSSILRTFEKKYTKYDYLNISLATFSEDETSQKAKSTKNTLSALHQKEAKNEANRLIELSILQQMFYKVSDSDIPDSRFKRIKIVGIKELTLLIGLSMTWICSLSFVLWPKFFARTSWWESLDNQQRDLFLYISVGLFLSVTTILLRSLILKFNKYQFNKLNLSSGEIEINPKSETSILNKYLDEILYFFEKMPYDVVLIEDLDRFNDPEIFTKLRELNLLINNAKSIKAKKNVRFVYAIKDDMFLDNTRTKFFDFIIPVLPIITSANSLDIILNTEKRKKIIADMPENFVADIMLYVSDMRVLKNIFNEYFIYRDSLKKVRPKPEKLFAIITYKNIYPKDFAELHENKGILHRAFEEKGKTIEKMIDEIKLKISNLEQRRSELSTRSELKIEEINKVYLFNLRLMLPYANALQLNNIRYEWDELVDQNEFKTLIGRKKFAYFYSDPSESEEELETKEISFEQVEQKTDPDLSYNDRIELSEKAGGKLIKDIDEKLLDYKQKLLKVEHQSLKTILDMEMEIESSKIIDEELGSKKLLVYLIKHGYIDEMYPTLISYFHEGSLMQKDMEFLMSVKDQEPLQPDFKIVMAENLCKRISINEFGRIEVLNHQLTNFILEHSDTNKEKLDRFLSQFIKPNERAINFFYSYQSAGSQVGKFIYLIGKQWKHMVEDIFWNDTLPIETKHEQLFLMLSHVDLEDLIRHNENGKLAIFISQISRFIALFKKEQYDRLKSIIKNLEVKFEFLAHPTNQQNDLVDFIYENHYYQLNKEIIIFWFNYHGINDNQTIKQLETSNYTTIQNSSLDFLKACIDANLEAYMANVFFDLDANTKESEESIIFFLTHDKITDIQKVKIINDEDFVLFDLNKVDKKFWQLLMELKKVLSLWDNVVAYFNETKTFDIHFTSFLNSKRVYKPLSNYSISSIEADQDAISLTAIEIIKYDQLSNEAFEHLINKSYTHYYVNPLVTIAEDRMSLLIDRKKIAWSANNYNKLKEVYTNLHIKLGFLHQKEFLKDLEKIKLDGIDVDVYLHWKKFNHSQRLLLINHISGEMIDEKPDLADFLLEILGKSTFRALDYPFLLSTFTYGTRNKDKAALFLMHLYALSEKEINQLLPLMGKPHKEIGTKPKSMIIDNNEQNLQLVVKLKEKRVIKKYKEEKDKIQISNK